jgi:hypothetical protein
MEGSTPVFGRLKTEDPAIRRIVLREAPMMAALPVDHRLAMLDRPLKLSELAQAPLLVYRKRRGRVSPTRCWIPSGNATSSRAR